MRVRRRLRSADHIDPDRMFSRGPTALDVLLAAETLHRLRRAVAPEAWRLVELQLGGDTTPRAAAGLGLSERAAQRRIHGLPGRLAGWPR
jgi:hypothetical protein